MLEHPHASSHLFKTHLDIANPQYLYQWSVTITRDTDSTTLDFHYATQRSPSLWHIVQQHQVIR
jgi:hypothetical protein